MGNVPQNIIDKIHKLLNLKEGAEAVGSLAEAENAAAKLQDLLMKYNLDLAEVRKAKQEERFEMHDDWVYMGDKADKRESTWVTMLCAAIARNSMCRVSVHDWHIHIIGEKNNVQLILYICDQMIEKVRIAEKFAWKIHDAQPDFYGKEKRGTFRRGFYQGACHGIDQRLRRQREEQMQAANPFAVMIVNQVKVVEDYWIEKYVKPWEEQVKQRQQQDEEDERNGKKKKKTKEVKVRDKKGISSTQGWRTGYDAGLEMEINKGVDRQPTKGNIE
jgi:rRNA processing protein Krr1/Pno1